MDSYLEVPVSKIQLPKELPSLTYYIDWENGRITGRCDGIAAVRQASQKAVFTPRFHCLIYNDQYGCELRDLIIYNNASRSFVESNVPWMVKDALSPDSRILDAHDFEFTFKDDGVYIKFTEDTIFGPTIIEGVI